MKRITKNELEERNARLDEENFCLRLPLERGETQAPHPNAKPIIAIEHDRSRPLGVPSANYTEVFFFCRTRAEGGILWLREVVPGASHPHLTAMYGMRFARLCDDRAALGFYEWRDAQHKYEDLFRRALDAAKAA